MTFFRSNHLSNPRLRQPNGILTMFLAAALLGGCRSDVPGADAIHPPDVVLDDAGAAYPTTAIDAVSGTIYVAYTRTHDGMTDVFVRRLAPGAAAPAEPVRVNDVAGDAASHGQAPAQVVAAPDGTLYVAWVAQTPVEGRRFPASNIRVARSTDGGRTFEPAVTAHADPGFPTGHHFHNLAVGPDGTLYVSWLDSEARDRAQLHGGAPAADAHGAGDLPGTQLKVARSADGRAFEPAVVVADGTCQCCRTALTAAPDGTVYVAWRHIFGDQVRDMALARSRDGGRTFSKPVRVHTDDWHINGCPHTGPAVTVDAHGQVYVIWYTGADGGEGVYYASSPDGGDTFGPAAGLTGRVSIAQVSAGAAPGGGALLAWENPRADSLFVGRAGTAALARIAGMRGTAPSMAVSGETVAIAWREAAQIRLRVLHVPGTEDGVPAS